MENKASVGLKNKLPWIIAIVLGVLSIAAVNKFLRLQQEGKDSSLIYLITAAADLSSGHELTRDDLKIALFPSDALSQISITVPGTSTTIGAEETERKLLMLIGRKTNRAIAAKEQIFWSDLMSLPRDHFPEHIPPRMRAVSIPVSLISSVSNLVEIGNKVDVVFTGDNTDHDTEKMFQLMALNASVNSDDSVEVVSEKTDTAGSPSNKKVQGSIILLANVAVIAIGNNFRGKTRSDDTVDGYASVTLLVTPDEGLLIAQAMNSGQLSLMLRSPSDVSAGDTMEITTENLIDSSRKLNLKRNAEGQK